MKSIKFKAWIKEEKLMIYFGLDTALSALGVYAFNVFNNKRPPIMQYTGLLDCHGEEIYEGDILQFSDKWEWYRGDYAIKMMFADKKEKEKLKKKYEQEPMERRQVELPEGYEWLLNHEIQEYWEVIGNKFENPSLLKPSP